ncbi:coiled-coil domain-containing protein 166-like [Spea bombifrons]|uniref:coiled-coil domain-containing protein 166-like n=1 Tax=Spea bombifrons TaxID=233779 RepID=UPI00234B524B|nr:coiled-coil domain-containing protein 166-like [Spea bombifrons]
MPPKIKSGGKAEEDAGRDVPPDAAGDGGKREVSEREALLQQEHDKLTAEQEALRGRLEQLRRENEFLQEEAERVRVESQEYLSYMKKRSQRRQDAIVSLSDQNQRELQDIQQQKGELQSRLDAEEAELREQLLQRERELARLTREIGELRPARELQTEQISLIKELQDQVMAARGRHAQALLAVQAAFLQERARCHQDCELQLQQLSEEAQAEATRALLEVSAKTEEENRQLRQELLRLIGHARLLQERKQKVTDQNQRLRRESREEPGEAGLPLQRA